MIVALVFFLLVTCAGLAVMRFLRVAKGPLVLALAPSAGLALAAALETWTTLGRLPPPTGGLLLVIAGLSGAVLIARGWRSIPWTLSTARREDQVAFALLGVALLMPVLVLGIAFRGVEVPISPHDGSFHVERIEALRHAAGWSGAYPPGLHATMAAFLQLVPWLDSAQGAFELSWGLTLLGQLALFGLGCALWRSPLLGAAGVLLASLTFQYPYSLHLWSVWPLMAGLTLTFGVWTAAVAYVEQPRAAWAVLGGLLAAGIVLTHGTELYTSGIGLAVLVITVFRRLRWRQVPLHLGFALGVGMLLAALYVQTLFGWAHEGGASAIGAATSSTPILRLGVTGDPSVLWLDSIGGALVDAPIRALLLIAGLAWALQRRAGGQLIALCLTFLTLALVVVDVDVPVVRWVFAVTFPWALGDRIAMVLAALASLLAGAGLVALTEVIGGLRRRANRGDRALERSAWRLMARGLALCIVFTTVGALWLLPMRLRAQAAPAVAYSADDAAAMDWLQLHASQGDVVANDGFADAGIWAPYKGHATLLLPNIQPDGSGVMRQLVANSMAHLADTPQATAAACKLRVRYVYRGAANTVRDTRQFPTVDVLRHSSHLEEVFSTGDASVFETRLPCPALPPGSGI